MKKPSQTPIDPDAPRSKKVKQIPMPRLYPETMGDDLYSPSDNHLDMINKTLDEIANEDTKNIN